jgi:hypothetical protein
VSSKIPGILLNFRGKLTGELATKTALVFSVLALRLMAQASPSLFNQVRTSASALISLLIKS